MSASWLVSLLLASMDPSAVLLPADPSADFEVGKPAELWVEVTHEPGEAVVLPVDLPWGEAWAERSRSRERIEGEAPPVERFRLEVIPFEPGRFRLGPFEVEVGGRTISTPPLQVVVRSNLPPEVQAALTASTALPPGRLEALAAPDPDAVPIFGPNLPLLLAVAGGLLALVALASGVRAWRRRRRAERPAPPPPPPRPAPELALEALTALARATPADRGGVNPYFTELSRILRRYLEAHFRFAATELTLEEIDEALARLQLPREARTDLVELLEEADYVKFARFEPTDAAAQAAVRRGVDLVERTRAHGGAIGAGPGLQVPASFPTEAEARSEGGVAS